MHHPVHRPAFHPSRHRAPSCAAQRGDSITPTLALPLMLALALAVALAMVLLCAPASAQPASPQHPAADSGRLEISAAAPPDAETLAAMRAWHADYRRRTLPAQRSTAALNRALDRQYPSLTGPCGRLERALDDPELAEAFPAPDRAVDRHLRDAFADLRRGVRACRALRPAELMYHLAKARGSFQNAELALRPYRLKP